MSQCIDKDLTNQAKILTLTTTTTNISGGKLLGFYPI